MTGRKSTDGKRSDPKARGAEILSKPEPRRPHRYELKELVDQIAPKNRPKLIDWGKPVGKEIW